MATETITTTIFAEVIEMINSVLEEIPVDEFITRESTMQELGLESFDLMDLAGRIQARYPNGGNFALFTSGLDLSSVGEMQVGQLVDFIAGIPRSVEVDSLDAIETSAGADFAKQGPDER